MAHPAGHKTGINTSCSCASNIGPLQQSMSLHCHHQHTSNQDIFVCDTKEPAKVNMIPNHTACTCMCCTCHTRSLCMMRYLTTCMSHVQNILSINALFNCHNNFYVPGYEILQCGNHCQDFSCLPSQTDVYPPCFSKPQACLNFPQTHVLNSCAMKKSCNCRSESSSPESVPAAENQIKKGSNPSCQLMSVANAQCRGLNNSSWHHMPSHPCKKESNICCTQTTENQSVCKNCVTTDMETQEEKKKEYNESNSFKNKEVRFIEESKSEQVIVDNSEIQEKPIAGNNYNETKDLTKNVNILFKSSKRSISDVFKELSTGNRLSKSKMNTINRDQHLNRQKKAKVSKASVSLPTVKDKEINEHCPITNRKTSSYKSLTSSNDFYSKLTNISHGSEDDPENLSEELTSGNVQKLCKNNLINNENDCAASENVAIKTTTENHISENTDKNVKSEIHSSKENRLDEMTKTSSIEFVSEIETEDIKTADSNDKINRELTTENLCAVLLARVHSCVCQDHSVLFDQLSITPIKCNTSAVEKSKISYVATSENTNEYVPVETPWVGESISKNVSENENVTDNDECSEPMDTITSSSYLSDNIDNTVDFKETVTENCLSNYDAHKEGTKNNDQQVESSTEITDSSASSTNIPETQEAHENEEKFQISIAKNSAENVCDAFSNLINDEVKSNKQEAEIISDAKSNISNFKSSTEIYSKEEGEKANADDDKEDDSKLEKLEKHNTVIAIEVNPNYDEICELESSSEYDFDENLDHFTENDSDHDDIDELLKRCEIFKQFEKCPLLKETSFNDPDCTFKYLPDISEEAETQFENVTQCSVSTFVKNNRELASPDSLNILGINKNENNPTNVNMSESKSQVEPETEQTSSKKSRLGSNVSLIYDDISRTSVNTEYKSAGSDETNSCDNNFLSLENIHNYIPRSLTFIEENDVNYQETIAMPDENEPREDYSETYAYDSDLENQNNTEVEIAKCDSDASVNTSLDIEEKESETTFEDTEIQSQIEPELSSPITSTLHENTNKNIEKQSGDNINLFDVKPEGIPKRLTYSDLRKNYKKPQQSGDTLITKRDKTVISQDIAETQEKGKTCEKSVRGLRTVKLSNKIDSKTFSAPLQKKPTFSKPK